MNFLWETEPWQEFAACAGMGEKIDFFDGHNDELPRRLCANCEVQPECLDYALRTNQPSGIWGGLDEGERRKAKRKREYLRDVFVDEILAPYRH